MQEGEMKIIAHLIHQALTGREDNGLQAKLRKQVRELCEAFPLYQDLHVLGRD